MRKNAASRRAFLAESAGGISAVWLAANLPAVLAAKEHAKAAVASGKPANFGFFSAEQAAEVEALTAQIIPTDSTPGAREAGSVHFIDRALTTYERERQSAYTQGLADLQAKTRELVPGAAKFSALTSAQQTQVVKAIERTPFFNLVRTHTITGFVANPEYGGNNDEAGWKLIGFEDKFNYSPPFGYYDRDYRAQAAGPSGASSSLLKKG